MKSRFVYGILIPLLSLFLVSFSQGATYPLSLEYNRTTRFSSFRKKVGPTLGIAPFQDQRPGEAYIGRYTSPRNSTSYLKSEPMPLERAIQESLRKALTRSGVETIPILGWDGKPESMKKMNVG